MSGFPGKRTFACTIFDDTDGSTLDNIRPVYRFLAQVGLRTTKSVWSLQCSPQAPYRGGTLQDREYLEFVRNLRDDGFEIALHNVCNYDARRDLVSHGLMEFERLVGYLPRSHANHMFNRDNLYWGAERLSDRFARMVYKLALRHRRAWSCYGHVPDSPYFWGDLCRQHLSYVRNFVFGDINLDKLGAAVPYHDPSKPFVNYWFSACEGGNVTRFCRLLSERNQDQLESEGGICIVYAHFAEGFVEHGQLHPRFEYLIRRLAKHNGWFVPTSTLLDYLRATSPRPDIAPSELARLEWRWLGHKFRVGPT